MTTLLIRGAALGLAMAGTVALVPPELAQAARPPAVTDTNVVVEWNVHAADAFARSGRATGIAGPNYAIVQGAVYDAVNAITRTHQPYLAAPPAKRWYSQEAAAATSAYRALVALVPDQQPYLQPHYEQSLARIPDGAAKSGGITVGERAAATMLLARENDGRNGPPIWEIGTEPGQWRPTPPDFTTDPASWLANVEPFLVPSAEQFRSNGPPSLTSVAYARDFIEIKEYGAKSGSSRTSEQTDVALFWDQSPWNEIIRSLVISEHLNTGDSARLFAMASLSAADGAILCHNDKYYWNWWRPVTAIQEAGTDGNPATKPDPSWTPLIETPPTPDHPSGHTCTSAAVVGALQTFFGTDQMRFSATSASSGTTRHFTRFSQALRETIDARVWSGIHFRTADIQGAQLGHNVTQWARRNYFQPTR